MRRGRRRGAAGSGASQEGLSLFTCPTWTQTVGNLKAEGALVEVRCSRCDTTLPVDVDRLIREKGPLFSLWNRHPPCKTCGSPVWFKASIPGAGWWPVQMREAHPNAVAPLHERWRQSYMSAG